VNTPDPLTAQVLPDSRERVISAPRNVQYMAGAYWVPIYCASCHVEGGRVPQENMTFAFWLCQECFAKYGELTNMLVMPDEVFWEKVRQEQLDKYGRLLSPKELLDVVEADATPLSALIKQGR